MTEFGEGRKHLSESKDGKRSKHSPDYEANVASWLNAFVNAHFGHAVCDLSKDHLSLYIGAFKQLSAKSRNDRRAAIKMFLRWCAAKDYLAKAHRLTIPAVRLSVWWLQKNESSRSSSSTFPSLNSTKKPLY